MAFEFSLPCVYIRTSAESWEQDSMGQFTAAAEPQGQALDIFPQWSLTPQKVVFAGLQLDPCLLHAMLVWALEVTAAPSTHHKTVAEQIRSGGLDTQHF